MPTWFGSRRERQRAILVGTLVILVVVVFLIAWPALLPFFLGLMLAYILLPAVNFLDRRFPQFLHKRRLSRPLAIGIVYILVAGLIAAFLAGFIPAVSKQFRVLNLVLPSYWRRVQSMISVDIQPYYERVPEEIRTAIDVNIQRFAETLGDAIQMGVGVTIRTVSQTVGFVVGLVIVPVWLFYILNDETKALRAFYSMIPRQARADVRAVASIVDDLLSAYVRGQLVLCLVVGVLCMIVCVIFGVDLALLLGTFAGIFELIPYLGPYIGAIPAVLFALLDSPLTALWVGLSYAGIQQVENMFLVPRIQGSNVRFHPAVVMVIVIVGAEVAGLWGLLLALPLTAMVRDVFQYLYLRTTDRGATPQMALELIEARRFSR